MLHLSLALRLNRGMTDTYTMTSLTGLSVKGKQMVLSHYEPTKVFFTGNCTRSGVQ